MTKNMCYYNRFFFNVLVIVFRAQHVKYLSINKELVYILFILDLNFIDYIVMIWLINISITITTYQLRLFLIRFYRMGSTVKLFKVSNKTE